MDHSVGQPGQHLCCHMSRRKFLSGLAAFAGAGALASRFDRPVWATDLDGYVDIHKLRPRPSVRVLMAVVRIPTPYWLGWPGTTYDVEGHSREYLTAFEKAGRELGVTVRGVEAPIESDQGIAEFLNRADKEKPDAVLMILQHMSAWSWMQRVADAGFPTIIFSPIGTSFTGHVIGISRQPGVHVVSSLELEGVRQALRAVRCRKQLMATRLLHVHGGSRSEAVLPHLGVKVRAIPRRVFRELFDRMPENEEVKELAQYSARTVTRIVEPTRQDLLNATRTFTTAKRLLADEDAHGLSMDCLGMVGARIVPTPPCWAWSMLQDAGVTAGCEADLYAAVSLMFSSYLLDRPGFINDPVAETVKNRLIVAHCTSGRLLNGFGTAPVDCILRSHSESALGVSTQVLWPEGKKCTLISFVDNKRVIVDTGTVAENVPTPPAGGCRTSFEVIMDNVEDARDVLGFHQVVCLGDHRRAVDAYAQMYGLEVIRSPERAPRVERGRSA